MTSKEEKYPYYKFCKISIQIQVLGQEEGLIGD